MKRDTHLLTWSSSSDLPKVYNNRIENCGVDDFVLDGGGKNGEGIYLGKAGGPPSPQVEPPMASLARINTRRRPIVRLCVILPTIFPCRSSLRSPTPEMAVVIVCRSLTRRVPLDAYLDIVSWPYRAVQDWLAAPWERARGQSERPSRESRAFVARHRPRAHLPRPHLR